MRGIFLAMTVVLLIFTLLATLSCASTAPSVVTPAKPVPGPAKATGAPSWDAKWQETLALARKEGKVVIYGLSSAPAIKEQAPLFYKKFGIELEVLALDRGPLLTAKIFNERRAGLYLPDIYNGGTNTFFGVMKPAGLADPQEPALILPEVIDPNNWFGGELPWGDKERLLLESYAYPNTNIAVNTDLVNPQEIRSYYDIANPRFKGKIIMNDPTIAGTGLKSFSILGFAILKLDFFKQIAALEPTIIRDQRLQVDWLAKGKYAILMFPRTAPVTEYKEAGAPITFVSPAEGTYLSAGGGNNAIMNKAPHPNAARIFVNWFYSREGQTLITAIDGLQSARVDVPPGTSDSLKIRQPGVKYFLGGDKEEWLSRDPEFTKAALDIFGAFLK